MRHLAAARFFESQATDELAGALAGHYLAAHATAPAGPEADALATQARIALEGAAQRASALGSNDQAVAFLEQALVVASRLEDRAEILVRAGTAAGAGGHATRAEELLEQAIALHRDAGNRLAAARATSELGMALILGRRLDQAIAVLGPAVAEFADLFPDPVVVGLEGRLARAQFLDGELGPALRTVDRVLDAAERAPLLDVLADALVTKGTALAYLGRVREGVGVIEIGERIAETQGFTAIHIRAINNRVSLLGMVEPRSASDAVREGLELARRIGLRPAMYSMQQSVAWVQLNLDGDADGALATLDSVLDEKSDSGDRIFTLDVVAWIRAARGEDVTSLLDEIDRGSVGITDPRVAGLAARAWLAFLDGRYADAIAAFRRATAIDDVGLEQQWVGRAGLWTGDLVATEDALARVEAEPFLPPTAQLRALGLHAGTEAAHGGIDRALELYRELLRGWTDLEMVFEEGMTSLDMAVLLDPSIPAVRAAAERAREVFTQMGFVRLLDALDAALATPRSTAGRAAGRSDPAVVREPA